MVNHLMQRGSRSGGIEIRRAGVLCIVFRIGGCPDATGFRRCSLEILPDGWSGRMQKTLGSGDFELALTSFCAHY